MSMTLAEAHEQHSKSSANRAMVIVRRNDDGDYEAEWEGRTFTAISPWALDTILDGHAPTPRNLYLVSGDDE